KCARHTAPAESVDELATEGRLRPLLARCRDDVDVPVQEKRRTSSAAGDARDEVRPRRILRVRLGLAACALEQLLDDLDACALVPGRVRRVEPEQLLKELYGSH